jgi:predicted nucleic acid-binding protein
VFLDTSVLVAAIRTTDKRHQASSALVAQCTPQNASIAAHTLAETYANLTGMPAPNRFRTSQAVQILEAIRIRFDCIALTPDEVLQTARYASDSHLAGGIIYDALLLACARKVNPDHIYTWNLRHFHLVAPDLKDRIVTPYDCIDP